MANDVTSTETKTKLPVIIGAVLGAVALIFVAIFAAFFLQAPEDTKTNPDGSVKEEIIPMDEVPLPEDFKVEQSEENPLEANISFDLTKELPARTTLEYRVEDDLLNTLVSGDTTQQGLVKNLVLLKKGSTNVQLKVRLVGEKKASDWVTVATHPVTTPEREAKAEREVNPAYYETDWAKKKVDNAEALSEAYYAAFGVPTVNMYDNGLDSCYLGNEDTVRLGEIIRPRPEYGSEYDLKVSITPTDGEYNVLFIWCE